MSCKSHIFHSAWFINTLLWYRSLDVMWDFPGAGQLNTPPTLEDCILLSCMATLHGKRHPWWQQRKKKKNRKTTLLVSKVPIKQVPDIWYTPHILWFPKGARFTRNSEWLFRYSYYSPDEWAQFHCSLGSTIHGHLVFFTCQLWDSWCSWK